MGVSMTKEIEEIELENGKVQVCVRFKWSC